MPPLPPSLVQLLWFVRVVEAGSFAEAARRSGATTSAMSKAVSRLEQTHGVRLLHRTTHSLSLTEEGDRLLIEGRQLLVDLERANSVLGEIGGGGAGGRVRVCAPSSFARTCILPELPAFLRTHPDIDIELQFKHDVADLAARGVDLAIASGSFDGLPGHVSRKLCTFPYIACASPDYLRVHGVPATPADLNNHQLVGYRNPATGQLDGWRFTDPSDQRTFRQAPRPRHVFDDGEAAWNMIRSGFGIGWAPAWLGVDDFRTGKVVEVLGAWRSAQAPLYAIRLDKRLTPKRTQIVLDFIAELAGRLPA